MVPDGGRTASVAVVVYDGIFGNLEFAVCRTFDLNVRDFVGRPVSRFCEPLNEPRWSVDNSFQSLPRCSLDHFA